MSQQNYYNYNASNTGYAGGAGPTTYAAGYNYGAVGQQPAASHGYSYGTGGATKQTTSGYYATPSDTAQPAAAKAYATNQSSSNYPYSSAGGGSTTDGAAYGRTSANSGSAGFGNSVAQSSGKTGAAGYSGYDAAVYAAATNYLQSKQPTQNASSNFATGANRGALGGGGRGGNAGGRGSFPRKRNKPNYVQDPSQMHYCEVCKVSCGSADTLKSHLEGKNHKKKELALKTGTVTQPLARLKSSYKCDLCGIICTGQDTYTAHVRGTKHQKTVKLHQQLGKPVPDDKNPTVILPSDPTSQKAAMSQKVNFAAVIGQEPGKEVAAVVGEDFVEMVKDEAGRNAYHCKLCDCGFTDLNAKDMHMKGRRHRLMYKKKVDPSIDVDMNVTSKYRRIGPSEEKLRRELMKLRQEELYTMRAQYEVEMKMLMASRGPNRGSLFPTWAYGGHYETIDDSYVIAKHTAIYPTEDELTAVQKIVTHAEKALKSVSDAIATEDTAAMKLSKGKTTDDAEPIFDRLLKGVMRVGPLAKGLLLQGRMQVQLVVLCSEKPNRTLLSKVVNKLPKEFETLECKEDYLVTMKPQESCFIMATKSEPKVTLTVTLTAASMRETDGGAGVVVTKPDPPDVLNKRKCLEALSALRHAKWFQARCSNLQSCLIVLRVLLDLCKRVPTWAHLTPWAAELLCEKVMSSAGGPVSPGEGFRRVFEAVASGVVLLSGPGLMDPCEKEPVDAVSNMTPQQREDITSSAQHALRLVAFDQLYKVLALEKLPDKKVERKRPRESVDSNSESDGKQVKKGEEKKENGVKEINKKETDKKLIDAKEIKKETETKKLSDAKGNQKKK